jgi:hypothetical protein
MRNFVLPTSFRMDDATHQNLEKLASHLKTSKNRTVILLINMMAAGLPIRSDITPRMIVNQREKEAKNGTTKIYN